MDIILKLLEAHESEIARREDAVARQVAQALERARRDLLNDLARAYAALGGESSPARVRQLVDQAAMVRAIERRMAELAAQLGDVVGEALTGVVDEATTAVMAELEALAAEAGYDFFPFALDETLELTIAPAVEQVQEFSRNVASQLVAELRTGLASGERFSELATRLYDARISDGAASIFRRGMTSAELMARRAVIQANNNSRLIFLDEGKKRYMPSLKKQAVAAVQAKTTATCLRVHGQVRELDEPFELTAEPRFARRMMAPPFHWNCRTAVVGYLEELDTDMADMRREARAELARRN